MGYIDSWELDQGEWAELGTAMIKSVNYNTIGPFPHDVLEQPTTTGFMIDVYIHMLLIFLSAEFLESLYLESLIESMDEDEKYYGYVYYDYDRGEFD